MRILIPASEAAHIFVRETKGQDGDYIAARAYLPTEYDWCAKCDAREGHSHPQKAAYTEAEIAQAVAQYQEDDFLRRVGA
jgi:hypothetical protein